MNKDEDLPLDENVDESALLDEIFGSWDEAELDDELNDLDLYSLEYEELPF